MNRFERELKDRSGIINNRRWEGARRSAAIGYEVSEVHPDGAGCAHVMPNYWHGKPNLGFGALDNARFWRHGAMAIDRRSPRRAPLIAYARQSIERSRELRLRHDPAAPALARAA